MATLQDRIAQLYDEAKDADYKLTKDQFAMKYGGSRSQLNGWLAGKGNPNSPTLHRLADIFKVSTDWLLGYTDDRSATALPSPETKKPKDLDEFLREPDIMFKGTPLSDDAKERLRNILTEIDGMAKEMNKRKK